MKIPANRRLVNAALAFSLTLATAAILGNWGYDTTTILAGLGVGGLAIALAAQKTIENLFGGIAVISDRPVFVGDVCVSEIARVRWRTSACDPHASARQTAAW